MSISNKCSPLIPMTKNYYNVGFGQFQHRDWMAFKVLQIDHENAYCGILQYRLKNHPRVASYIKIVIPLKRFRGVEIHEGRSYRMSFQVAIIDGGMFEGMRCTQYEVGEIERDHSVWELKLIHRYAGKYKIERKAYKKY